MDTFLRDMVKADKWGPQSYAPLHGKQAGLMELRWKSGKVQHRILGFERADHEYLMLIGCTHKESYDPQDALETVLVRWKQIQNGEATFDEYKLVVGR